MFKFDGWRNLLTGLGVKGVDNRTESLAQWVRLDRHYVEELYASDELATKVVDYLPEEMLKKDFKFSHKKADPLFNEMMSDLFKNQKLKPKILDAMKQARLYGEAYILMGINDGNEHDEPLEIDKIKSFDWCHVFNKWQLTADELGDDVTSEFYDKPITYRLVKFNEENLSVIHATRLIKFSGSKLPYQLFKRNFHTDDSVLNKIQNSLANYNTACDSLASTIHEFSLGIFKMKGLAKLVGAGKESQVITRMGMINAKKSVVRAIVLDSDEEYKRENVALTGLPDVVKTLGNKFVSDSNMPHTIVMGEGPKSSLGKGGESEKSDWYDYVAKKQEADLEPQLKRLSEILLKSDNQEIPVGLDVDFESLHEMSDLQKADIRLKTSQADAADILNQVLDPDEVAISRFGSGKYSIDTMINNDLRNIDKPKSTEDN